MKNTTEKNRSSDQQQSKTCNDKENCMKIKKTRNLILWAAVGLIALVYFLLIPSADQIKQLSKQVSPTVSLYSNPKSLGEQFPLLDDNNQTLTLSDVTKNKWSILYFGYTSCPDVCPTDLAILNQTLGQMQHADKLQVVFVSVDPKRDIGNLSTFVKRFNADFVGVSATSEALAGMTKFLGVYHEVAKTQQKAQTQDHSMHKGMKMDMKGMKTNDNYLINHTASYLLLNPELQLTGLLTNPHYATKMAKALDLIITTLD